MRELKHNNKRPDPKAKTNRHSRKRRNDSGTCQEHDRLAQVSDKVSVEGAVDIRRQEVEPRPCASEGRGRRASRVCAAASQIGIAEAKAVGWWC